MDSIGTKYSEGSSASPTTTPTSAFPTSSSAFASLANEALARQDASAISTFPSPVANEPEETVLDEAFSESSSISEADVPSASSTSSSPDYPTYVPSSELRILPAFRPFYKKHLFSKLSVQQQSLLSQQRQLYHPMQSNISALIESFERGFDRSGVFDDRPRSEFYTISGADMTHWTPLLMDAFSYCEHGSLVVEVIFNVKYIFKDKGKSRGKAVLAEEWKAVYDGEIASNELPSDYHRHSILCQFRFPNACSNGTHMFDVFSIPSYYHYQITPFHIPHFTEQRYYLSACTSIDKSPPGQVKTWINYYYFHGVEHFTIYLNDRVAKWRSILRRYVEQGLVDLMEFTYYRHRTLYEQASALNSCNRRYRYASKLVIYNDVDEFFLPQREDWRIVDVVRLYDETFPLIDAFRVVIVYHGDA